MKLVVAEPQKRAVFVANFSHNRRDHYMTKNSNDTSKNNLDNSGTANNQNHYLEELFGNSAASRIMDMMYESINRKPENLNPFTELENILDSCSKQPIPDCTGFLSFLYNKTGVHLDTIEPRYKALTNVRELTNGFAYEFYVLLLYREYEKKLRNKEGNLSCRDILKYKLLLSSVLAFGERFVRSVTALFNDTEDEYLDEGLEKLDWIQLKNRFLKAVMLKEKSKAFKILGRLSNLDNRT